MRHQREGQGAVRQQRAAGQPVRVHDRLGRRAVLSNSSRSKPGAGDGPGFRDSQVGSGPWLALAGSGRVAGGFAEVGTAGGEGPGEVAGLSGAFDVPAGCLFAAVVVPAARVAVAGTSPALRPGDGVLVVGPVFRGPAGPEGAVLVQHRGQVLQVFSGVVAW